ARLRRRAQERCPKKGVRHLFPKASAKKVSDTFFRENGVRHLFHLTPFSRSECLAPVPSAARRFAYPDPGERRRVGGQLRIARRRAASREHVRDQIRIFTVGEKARVVLRHRRAQILEE